MKETREGDDLPYETVRRRVLPAARDVRRAVASLLVLGLVATFVTRDFGSPEMALAATLESSSATLETTDADSLQALPWWQRKTAIVYGRVESQTGPYTVIARHLTEDGFTEDVRTTTAADGTYRLVMTRPWGIERITIKNKATGERASKLIFIFPWAVYRIDARVTNRFRIWFVPVFGY